MADHVLITVDTDGTADFACSGEVEVVLIDYRKAHASSFPDEVDAMTKQVKAIPDTVPWKEQTILALKDISREKRSDLMARLPLFDEDLDADHLPDVGAEG